MLLSLAFLPFLLTSGQDVVARPGDELRTSYHSLKAAEEKKDTDQIVKFATASSKAAREMIQSKEPPQSDDIEAWKAGVELAREVGPYADYALYAAALRDHARLIELVDVLEKQNPSSKYLSQMYGLYLGALSQKPGGANKAFDFAGKAIAKDPNNEELLMVLADGAMTRKQWDRAAMFGTKLATVLGAHPRPEGTPTGDWERRRTALMARGYYIAGISYASVNKFSQADKSLRSAMPLVKSEPALYGPTMFYLGLANYQMARVTQDKPRMKEALAFSEEAYKAGGPMSQAANQNAYAIKQELLKMR